MTYEEFAEAAGALAAEGRQFIADRRDEITGAAGDGSRSASLIARIVDLLPALEMAVRERARELAPPPELNFAGPVASGTLTLAGGPMDGETLFDDGHWELGTIREIGDPPFPYRRTGIDAAAAVGEQA